MDESKIFLSHGEYHYVYLVALGKESAKLFIEYGTDVTFKTYPDGHGVTPENLQDIVAFIASDLVTTIN